MKIIILTGNETRHEFFRKKIASDARISVLTTYCEGAEKSLENRIKLNKESSELELQHVRARSQAEKDFFEVSLNSINDLSNAHYISKGAINDEKLVQDIINKQPDLLVCYGSSLIRSKLLTEFEGHFLNVHLGLSPYYRGVGTNIWPLINNEPDMVGATFMYINEGIDTGPIIVQRKVEVGDRTQEELIKYTKMIGMESIAEAVEKIDSGNVKTLENNDEDQTYFSFPKKEDVSIFKKRKKKFF